LIGRLFHPFSEGFDMHGLNHTARPASSLSVLGMLLMAVLVLLLGGCAGMSNVTSQVSSFGTWPAGRQPGRYVFERLPSQQSQPELQDQLEAAAQPVLAQAGFALAANAAQADVSVQVGSQLQVDRVPRHDPFWSPYGAYGPYGPFGRPGWAGWWGSGGRGGVSFSMAMEPPYVQMQVDVLIRDRAGNQVLYEAHARHERVGAADPRLWPYLFEAALKDFPHPAVSPRTVTVTIPPDNR
jgi:hypothetical protein